MALPKSLEELLKSAMPSKPPYSAAGGKEPPYLFFDAKERARLMVEAVVQATCRLLSASDGAREQCLPLLDEVRDAWKARAYQFNPKCDNPEHDHSAEAAAFKNRPDVLGLVVDAVRVALNITLGIGPEAALAAVSDKVLEGKQEGETSH